MHKEQNNQGGVSVLASLRTLRPERRLTFSEAIQIAELQASRLLQLQDVDDTPVPDEVVTSLPRVIVEYDRSLPPVVSGCSDWDQSRRAWVISINPKEPRTRRRLTVLHEYKHIIDHGSRGLIRAQAAPGLHMAPEEYIADYFAGCVLMPRRQVKAAWVTYSQELGKLARHFDVSGRAMQVRLNQVGLLTTSDERPVELERRRWRSAGKFGQRRYHRQSDWPRAQSVCEVAS